MTTSLTQTPHVRRVTEGSIVNPDEAAYAGVSPGFKPQEAPPPGSHRLPAPQADIGGQELDIPLRYKQEIEAEQEVAADKAIEAKQRGEMIYMPGIGMVNKALVPLFSARERVSNKQVERSIDRGNVVDVYYTDGTMESQPKGAAPTNTTPSEKRKWVTNAKSGQREYVSEEQAASAPPGTYSDVRPPSARVVKADPAKLRMAISALGGPGVQNSLWALAVKINTDTGLMAALKGVGKRKLTELAPEMASQSNDPQLKMINMYNTAIQGFASSIAKAFGESGVLTNQDIARATGLFPKPGESPDTTVQKLQRVKSVMESGMQDPAMFKEIFGRDPSIKGGGGAAPTGAGTPDDPIVLE